MCFVLGTGGFLTEAQSGNVLAGVELEGLGCHCDGCAWGLVEGNSGG